MSTFTRTPNLAKRFYSNDDLHAAGLVFLSRKDTVKRRLQAMYGGLVGEDHLAAILLHAELLFTCNEQLFSDIEDMI